MHQLFLLKEIQAFTHNSVKEVIDYLIAEGVDVNAPEKISDIQSDGCFLKALLYFL